MMPSQFSKIRLLPLFIVMALFMGAGCAAKKMPGDDVHITVTGEPAERVGRQDDAMQAVGTPAETGQQSDADAVARPEKPAGGTDITAESDKAGRSGTAASRMGQGGEAALDMQDKQKAEAASAQAETPGKKEIILNFENAELIDVVRHISEMLDINYILDAEVKGKVTIHTAGKLSRSELWPIFFRLLEINGLTAVKRGEYYHVVASGDIARLPASSTVGREMDVRGDIGGVIVQIIPLNNISAAEMTKLLTPFTSSDGKVFAQPETNTLVVVDYRDSIQKILAMVKTFDADIFDKIDYAFYTLEHVGAEEMVEILDKIFGAYTKEGGSNTVFIPIGRINTILVVSPDTDTFASVEGFINQLDIPRKGMAPQIYVYPVKNGQAGEIADLLNEVFRSVEKDQGRAGAEKETGISTNPFAAGAKKKRQEAALHKEADKGGAYGNNDKSNDAASKASASQKPAKEISDSNTLRDKVKIIADETRNSLIIEAIPPDYRMIVELLKQIDVLPRQVLIKMTIAEVTLDEKTELGVEWSYVKGAGSLDTSLLSATAGAGGFKYTIGELDRWTSALSALASKNKVNILSSPTVLASNSRNAKIDISQEVPVASSDIQYTSGDNPIVETDIEYRDTGVMLSVTPHINEVGLVTMDIEQEVSELAENVQVGDFTYPSFFKRRAETTLSVKSGQAIVIGGLIREKKTDNAAGTPWFVNIPVIGFLFGKTSDQITKEELIIFISPQVITELSDVDEITSNFEAKMKNIMNSE